MTNVRVPEQKAMADAFIAWLQAPDEFGNPAAMARRLGISYVIWNNQTWRAYDPARGWTDYNGCRAKKKAKRALDNTCHRTHVHISFTWDGALKRTSYYTGYVACPAPLPVVPAPVVPPLPPVPGMPLPVPVPDPVVPVTGPVLPLTPARLLGTKAGTGSVAGPCRVHPDVRFDLHVLGSGGVPATGVAAVVLRVQLVGPGCAGDPAGVARREPAAVGDRAAGCHRPGGRGDGAGRYGGQHQPAARRGDGAPACRRPRLRRCAGGLTPDQSGPTPRLVGR